MHTFTSLTSPRHQTVSLLAMGALLAAFAISPAAKAADADAGKAKAQSCVLCHGARGISQLPGAPNLAGQTAIYTTEQLKNFRSGKRSNEIMNVIAKPLSDADITELAAWYESIKISVAPE